jgi:hypothetical protein
LFPSSRIVSTLAERDGAVERSQPHVGEPSLPRNLDSKRGDVAPDHLVPATLEVQADAPSAAANIEHPPAHEPHRATLLRPPRPEGRQIVVRLTSEDAPIVALDDLDAATPGEEIAQQVTEGVFSGRENGAQQARRA